MNTTTESYYLVIGLGTSGLSMAKFLHSIGERVIGTDLDDSKVDVQKELTKLGIQTEIGIHNQDTFNNASVMIPSPGIPITNNYIRIALSKGVALVSELDIFTKYNKLPVIAITGTNGKTTTTTLIGEILRSCNLNPFVGGNIGTPLVENLMGKSKAKVVVAEISSFQLDISNNFKPDVGVLLNISEDHLDRYPDYQAYQDSKWSLFKNQSPSDTAVINQSIAGYKKQISKLKAKILSFSSSKSSTDSCQAKVTVNEIQFLLDTLDQKIDLAIKTDDFNELHGIHNKENMAAAILSCLSLGADLNDILEGVKTFKQLSHRISFVKTINNVSFYNDSKATNTDAVIRAIESFEKNIILILGGREKGTDFTQLLDHVKTSVLAIIALGESKQKITETFKTICPIHDVNSMKEAVQTAFRISKKNDVVLLSPACASFDMYENYGQRGNDFIAHIKGLNI